MIRLRILLWAQLIIMDMCATSCASSFDLDYGFSALYHLLTLLFASFLRCPIVLGETCIENDLRVEDILSLSRVSHSLHSYFDTFIRRYLRDEYDGDRFFSVAKCLITLQDPGINKEHHDKVRGYLLEKRPEYIVYLQSTKKRIPSLQSFWQPINHFSTGYGREASNSLDIWALRHGFRFDRKWFKDESEFQMMIVSPHVQVSSMAWVVTSLYQLSPYTFHLIRERLGTKSDSFDYHDIVAALSIPWYDPDRMFEALENYPIFTDEMVWNIVSRGNMTSNMRLLLMVLGKIYVKDATWTFSSPKSVPLNHVCNSITDIKTSSEFRRLLLKRARNVGLPKIMRKLIEKRLC